MDDGDFRTEIDAAWASHDEMRAALEELRDAITAYLDHQAPDLPAEWGLLRLLTEAWRRVSVPFCDPEQAPSDGLPSSVPTG